MTTGENDTALTTELSRRRMLAVAATGIGSLAGCITGSSTDDTPAQPTSTPNPTTQPTSPTPDPTTPTDTPPESPTQTDTPTPTPTTQIESFVDVDGTDLTINGETAHFFGTHPENIMDLSHPASWIEEMLDLLAQEGYTLARVPALQWFWGDASKQPQPGETNEDVMQRLDRVIAGARVRGIRLSLVLINGKPALHEGGDNYGVNVSTYANHAETADTYDEFYSNRECKDLYKQRVETVLTRENTITGIEYRNDPAIAMWELGNEIEYAEPWKHDDPTLQPWIKDMSQHVKSIDDNHLVTTGEFGWANRNNYRADHTPDSIDLCSIHYYPGPNSYDLANDPDRDHPGVLKELIETGHQDLGKPVYLGEYNWQVETGAQPPLAERNEQLQVIHELLDKMDVGAATYWSLALSNQQDWPRGGATTFGDTDDGSMTQFKRIAEIQYRKSAEATHPDLPAFN